MEKLWLTYAWVDNEREDVDFVIQELKRAGLDVHYDRRQIMPGQRIWPQIDKAITDPAVTDAWGIYVTEHSLRSEPCQEELAYALDRALRTRGSAFPIIGIFPRPIDRSLIPSSIATRLYVNTHSRDWVEQIVDGVKKQRRESSAVVSPFVATVHKYAGKHVVEVRPRAGRWAPFVALIPKDEVARVSFILSGPAGLVPTGGMVQIGSAENDQLIGKIIHTAITPETSAFIQFEGSLPNELVFGQAETPLYVCHPQSMNNGGTA